MTARAVPVLLATILLTGVSGLEKDWPLWPSPWDGAEELDQHLAPGEDGSFHVAASVGQTFVPRRSPLLRIDFKVDSARDRRPARLRIWRWAGDHRRTVASPPLFEDFVPMTDRFGYGLALVSFFPELPVEVGAKYYAEFSAEGRDPFRVGHSNDGTDRYPDGGMVLAGRIPAFLTRADLWFRTWSTPRRAATPPAPDASAERRWHALRPGPKEVARADYLELIHAWADRGRKAVLAGCGQELPHFASVYAFLYRASCERGRCEEERARDVVRLFEAASARRFCEPLPAAAGRSCRPACVPDEPVRRDFLEHPAIAYLWTRSSPSLRPEDHARIRTYLLDAGRRFWEEREVGVHAGALQGALGLRIVADLFPDAPEAVEWRAYTERVWAEVWRWRDLEEDSLDYGGLVWLPRLLQFVELTGRDDAVWQDPAFLSLIERFFAYLSPLGTTPSFGHGAGWTRNAGSLIWVFEKAARRTRDPRYRWAAARLFDYDRRSRRSDDLADDPMQQSFPFLAWAWLAADESLPATAPEPIHEALAAHQTAAAERILPVAVGGFVGQTFVAEATPLARLDLRLRSDDPGAPVRLSLWRWVGSREATTREPPLFRDVLAPLPGQEPARLSAFPLLDLEPGETYYIELARDSSTFGVEASERDAYEPGAAQTDPPGVIGDLWFASWTLAGEGSIVTTRQRAKLLPRSAWPADQPGRQLAFLPERVPDKLVLRSGFDSEDLHAVVNLLAGYGHGQTELGAFASLVDAGSVLVAGTPFPYWFHGNLMQDESLPLLKRYRGGSYGTPGESAAITRFTDSRNATVAWAEWKDPWGWQVHQERRIYFVKNRFVLVRDRFRFPEEMEAAVGPVWHFGDLRTGRGKNWFDAFYREPLGNVWKHRNRERYLLTWFAPRPATEVAGFEEPYFLPAEGCPPRSDAAKVKAECRSGPPFVVYQRWKGAVRAGESRWFDTLLLPHGPETGSEELAGRVRALHVGGGAIALELQIGDETWTVVESPDRRSIETPGLAVDARYAIVRSAPGRAPYVLAHEALRVARGELDEQWSVPATVERGGFPVSPRRATGAPGGR